MTTASRKRERVAKTGPRHSRKQEAPAWRPSGRFASIPVAALAADPAILLAALPGGKLVWPPIVPPLLVFIYELARFPTKIDEIIERISRIAEDGAPVGPPGAAPDYPVLRRLKRLIDEAGRAFVEGRNAEAKAKIEEAARVLMPPDALDEISAGYPILDGFPNGPRLEQLLRDDVRAEVEFMARVAATLD